MRTRFRFGITDFLMGCFSVVFLPFMLVFNTMGFLFYAVIFGLTAWLSSLLVEFPYSLIPAFFLFSMFWVRGSYHKLERWTARNNIARIFLLLAHIGAAVLCGRIAGYHLHQLYVITTPVITVQIIGAILLAWINIHQFFYRTDLTLAKCLSFRHTVKKQ